MFLSKLKMEKLKKNTDMLMVLLPYYLQRRTPAFPYFMSDKALQTYLMHSSTCQNGLGISAIILHILFNFICISSFPLFFKAIFIC